MRPLCWESISRNEMCAEWQESTAGVLRLDEAFDGKKQKNSRCLALRSACQKRVELDVSLQLLKGIFDFPHIKFKDRKAIKFIDSHY